MGSLSPMLIKKHALGMRACWSAAQAATTLEEAKKKIHDMREYGLSLEYVPTTEAKIEELLKTKS